MTIGDEKRPPKTRNKLAKPRPYAHCIHMKSNLAAIFLVVVCLGLGIFLWSQNQTHAVQAKHLSETIVSQNDLVTNLAGKARPAEVFTNTILETNLAAVQLKYSNDLAAAPANFHATLQLRQGAG